MESNSMKCHDQVSTASEIQRWFNVIIYINILNNVIIYKKKRSCNYLHSTGKIFQKIQDVFLVKMTFKRGIKDYFLNVAKYLAYQHLSYYFHGKAAAAFILISKTK